MAEIFRWYGDGLSAGALTTSSAGPGDTAPAAILGSTGPQIVTSGTRSPELSFAASPATDQCGARWEYTAATELGVRFYFTTGSSLPASGQIPQIVWIDDGGAFLVEVDYTSTGRINLRDNVGVIAQTAASTLTTNTTYRVELTVDHATGDLALDLFNGDSGTPLASLSGTSANLGAQTTRISLGKLNSATAPTHMFDSILVLDEAVMPGPVPPTGTTTARGGRLFGSVPEGTTTARGGRLLGALPPTFDVTIDSDDDLEHAEPGTTVTLTASATGGTVTGWTWEASGGVEIAPDDDECVLTVPATMYGQDITVTATATGTGASDGDASVVVRALPHNEWLASAAGWVPLFADAVSSA